MLGASCRVECNRCLAHRALVGVEGTRSRMHEAGSPTIPLRPVRPVSRGKRETHLRAARSRAAFPYPRARICARPDEGLVRRAAWLSRVQNSYKTATKGSRVIRLVPPHTYRGGQINAQSGGIFMRQTSRMERAAPLVAFAFGLGCSPGKANTGEDSGVISNPGSGTSSSGSGGPSASGSPGTSSGQVTGGSGAVGASGASVAPAGSGASGSPDAGVAADSGVLVADDASDKSDRPQSGPD
jgi:hypothetical protein